MCDIAGRGWVKELTGASRLPMVAFMPVRLPSGEYAQRQIFGALVCDLLYFYPFSPLL